MKNVVVFMENRKITNPRRENEIESYYKKNISWKKLRERNVEEEENQQVRLVPFVFEVCTCCW